MKAFLSSNAGVGTAGVILCCMIIVFPVIGTWLVAGLILVFSIRRLLDSFRELDDATGETPAAEGQSGREPEPNLAPVASRDEAPAFDVDAAMAEMAAQAARTVRAIR